MANRHPAPKSIIPTSRYARHGALHLPVTALGPALGPNNRFALVRRKEQVARAGRSQEPHDGLERDRHLVGVGVDEGRCVAHDGEHTRKLW